MKTYKEFLNEATFNVNKDVDMLYKKAYEKYIKEIIDYNIPKSMLKISSGKFPKKPRKLVIDSSELKSRDAKKAHKVNPIKIEFFGSYSDGNAYKPLEHKIVLNLNPQVINLIKDFGGINAASEVVDETQVEQFKDEISERHIKATIYHELSHWIDDSLHNKHITKMIQSLSDPKNLLKRDKILAQDGKDSIDSYYEVNAQIHALKQYKRSMKKSEWDKLTFSDIETYFANMSNVSKKLKSLYGDSEYKKWKKEILKRMSREGLLGKNIKLRK